VGATPVERLRALAVGDRFVPAAILGGRLAAHGERHGLAFDLRQVGPPYPALREYTGPVDGLVLTPHIAGASRDTVLRGADQLAATIVRHLVDGDLRGCVNAAAVPAP
jgi:D-3-phosphoglycerate dehydrogenase